MFGNLKLNRISSYLVWLAQASRREFLPSYVPLQFEGEVCDKQESSKSIILMSDFHQTIHSQTLEGGFFPCMDLLLDLQTRSIPISMHGSRTQHFLETLPDDREGGVGRVQ